MYRQEEGIYGCSFLWKGGNMDIKKILDIIKDGEEEIYSPENAVYFEDDTITKEEFDEGDETNEE